MASFFPGGRRSGGRASWPRQRARVWTGSASTSAGSVRFAGATPCVPSIFPRRAESLGPPPTRVAPSRSPTFGGRARFGPRKASIFGMRRPATARLRCHEFVADQAASCRRARRCASSPLADGALGRAGSVGPRARRRRRPWTLGQVQRSRRIEPGRSTSRPHQAPGARASGAHRSHRARSGASAQRAEGHHAGVVVACCARAQGRERWIDGSVVEGSGLSGHRNQFDCQLVRIGAGRSSCVRQACCCQACVRRTRRHACRYRLAVRMSRLGLAQCRHP